MCRLLCVSGEHDFAIEGHLDVFAGIARDSKEYQGHGWGCAWLEGDGWRVYRNIQPIWEDDERPAGRTRLLLAHARSAFRDEGICIENNMPFSDGRYVFIFNGELRGVRIKEDGRIGAEKIFNYVKRFDRGDMLEALRRGVDVIAKRTRYVRAMNIIMASPSDVYVASSFNEDPDYFQMQRRQEDGISVICSEAYPDESGWQAIAQGVGRA